MILEEKYKTYQAQFDVLKGKIKTQQEWRNFGQSAKVIAQRNKLPIELVEEYRVWLFNDGQVLEEQTEVKSFNEEGEIKVSTGKDGQMTLEKSIPLQKSLNDIVNFDEIYELFKVDKSKFFIKNYWGKMRTDGRLWGTVQFTLKYGGIDVETFKDAAKEFLSELPTIEYPTQSVYYGGDTLLICLSDQHIGARTLSDSMIPNIYNEDEYLKRLWVVFDKASDYIRRFDIQNVIVMGLGDALDGQMGKTAKGLAGKGTHTLPQNIEDRQAWLLYCNSTFSFVKALQSSHPNVNLSVRFVGDSNHGGDYEWWANHMIKEKLASINIPCTVEDEFIGCFKIGDRTVLYTHGSDSRCKRVMMDKNATPALQSYIMQWCANKGIVPSNLILLKGDFHVHNMELTPQGYYITAASLYGPSDYVAINYQNPSKGATLVHVSNNFVNSMHIEV